MSLINCIKNKHLSVRQADALGMISITLIAIIEPFLIFKFEENLFWDVIGSVIVLIIFGVFMFLLKNAQKKDEMARENFKASSELTLMIGQIILVLISGILAIMVKKNYLSINISEYISSAIMFYVALLFIIRHFIFVKLEAE